MCVVGLSSSGPPLSAGDRQCPDLGALKWQILYVWHDNWGRVADAVVGAGWTGPKVENARRDFGLLPDGPELTNYVPGPGHLAGEGDRLRHMSSQVLRTLRPDALAEPPGDAH